MASPAIVERNRANAQHSTGPTSETGKAASSQNARKHGLSGKLLLANQAEAQKYEQTIALYRKCYKLDDPSAEPLIRELAGAVVRLDQIRIAEQHALAEICDLYLDEVDQTQPIEQIRERLLGLAYLRDAENGNVLAKFHRYHMAANRTFFRCLTLLERMKSAEKERVISELDAQSARTQAVQNEPRPAAPIDLGNLPLFSNNPGKLHLDIPPDVLDMVCGPRKRKY